MAKHEIIIDFPDVSRAQAGRYAAELQDALMQDASDITVERVRSDPEAQDMGSTLVLIFGTPAAIAIARALGRWLERSHQAKIQITTKSGRVLGKNLESKDVADIIRALTHSGQPS